MQRLTSLSNTADKNQTFLTPIHLNEFLLTSLCIPFSFLLPWLYSMSLSILKSPPLCQESSIHLSNLSSNLLFSLTLPQLCPQVTICSLNFHFKYSSYIYNVYRCSSCPFDFYQPEPFKLVIGFSLYLYWKANLFNCHDGKDTYFSHFFIS